MTSYIKSGAEILLREAERFYAENNYIRCLEIAMIAYGANFSSESKLLIEKATRALDSLPSVEAVKSDPVKFDSAKPTELPPKQKESPKVESLRTETRSSSLSLSMSVMDAADSLFGAPEKTESKSGSNPPSQNSDEARSVFPEPTGVDPSKNQVSLIYPPMNSKEYDELYAEALREAEIDAKMGLDRTPNLSPEEQLKMDERAARAIIDSRDFFEMVGIRLWADVQAVEKAFKRTILKVHTDKNKSILAAQASETLTTEYKKFKAKPREYTVAIEKRRVQEGETPLYDPMNPHEGYGKGSSGSNGVSDDGFDCYGKRSYTWGAANSGPKRHTDVNPEGSGAMYASAAGEGAWLEKLEYSEATAHKFKDGKLQTFSGTGESRSKHGTRFIAKNNL